MDCAELPAPGVRFGENTNEVMALREKEKGDWKALSIEDKKSCMHFFIHFPLKYFSFLLL